MWCRVCLRPATRVSYSRDGVHVAPCGHHGWPPAVGVEFVRPVSWKAVAG